MKALMKLFVAALAVLPLAASAQTPAPDAKPAEAAPAAPAAAPAPAPAPAPKPAEAPTVKVTPYGFVQLSSYFNQNTFANKDYPGQVSSVQSGGSFLMSARYSRIGMRLALDDGNWSGAKLGGGLEFDFKAGHVASSFNTTCNAATPPVCTTTASAPSTAWYNGLMRLRLAFLTADWKTGYGDWQILAGQHYGIVAPLFATSLTWTADPLFWMAGNGWRRGPQVRATYKAPKELLGLNVAAAVLSPQTADGSVDFGSGNRSRMPSFEGRVGIDTKFDPVSVAVGAGYMVETRRYNGATAGTTKDIDGNQLAVDVALGSQWVDVKGEWFMQKGTSDTYNQIAPQVGPNTTTATKAVESDGFWAQAVVKPIPEVSIHAGYGQEKVDKGSATGAGLTLGATSRTESSQLAAGIIFNAGKFWRFGVEGIQVTTKYGDGKEQDGTQLAVSTQLSF